MVVVKVRGGKDAGGGGGLRGCLNLIPHYPHISVGVQVAADGEIPSTRID